MTGFVLTVKVGDFSHSLFCASARQACFCWRFQRWFWRWREQSG